MTIDPRSFRDEQKVNKASALSLTWADIDLVNCQLSVNRTMQFMNNEVTFKAPKTKASRRKIALSPAAMAVLRLHRDQQDGIRQTIGLPKTTDNDLIFGHIDGKPYLPNTITHAWIKLVRHCGLTGVRLHDARHSHASLMLKNGTSLKVIQERLGHSNFGITANIYAHVSPNMQREAANSFDDLVIKTRKSLLAIR